MLQLHIEAVKGNHVRTGWRLENNISFKLACLILSWPIMFLADDNEVPVGLPTPLFSYLHDGCSPTTTSLQFTSVPDQMWPSMVSLPSQPKPTQYLLR